MRRKNTETASPACEITVFETQGDQDFDTVVRALRRRPRPITITIRYRIGRSEQARRVNAIKVENGGLQVKNATGANHLGRIEKHGSKLYFLTVT